MTAPSYTAPMAKLTDSRYEIARPTGVCAATGKPIQPGDTFVAVLAERGDDEGLLRLDYSAQAWDSGSRPEEPLRVFGHWRSIMLAPDASKRPFIDDESMMDLLEQLEGADEPSRLSFRYVLALMLIRKRLYKFEGTVQEGGEGSRPAIRLRRVTPAGQPPAEPITVIDPGMDESAIAAAVEQLGSVMAGE
jgi:hypothetical protein